MVAGTGVGNGEPGIGNTDHFPSPDSRLPIPDFVKTYPFVGNFLDVGAARMHYLDEGAGPPVFLVHGNPTWSYFYRNLIPALRGKLRVIAPDHVGCGLSDKPLMPQYPYSLARRVQDFGRLVDYIAPKGRVSLVVHDWGGMIGMAWATANPDRVDRLVVMNTAAFHLPAGKPLPWSLKMSRWPLVGSLLTRGLNTFCRGAAKYCVVRRPLPKDVRCMFLAPYDSWQNRVAVDQFVKTIPLRPSDEGYDTVARTQERLSMLADRPMLLAWGLQDFVFDGDFLNVWQQHFPHAQVTALSDAGHYLLEDAGDELIPRIAKFLTT
jgi:haloalkane dehalogenase